MKNAAWTISILLLLLIGVACLLTPREPPVEIRGQLPANDVLQIESTVRRQWRQDVLPKLSWQGLKAAPAAVSDLMNFHLSLLVVAGNGTVAAGLTSKNTSDQLERNLIGYWLAKTNGVWRVTGGPFSDVPEIRVFYPPDWFE